MFFKQVRRNASKSRKDNGLFFGSLVIAIIAFYTLLSLSDQDVMLFLKTMESNAVDKLMLLIPLVYIISLFFVFFLVYFSYRYQIENRKKEFGLYLMLGMKKSKLFAMLMSETLWNSFVSILLGLPLALFLTEGISLTTAKMVGLGIVGHQVSISGTAVIGTVAGFVIVQMIAMLFLCTEFSRKEPVQLLQSDAAEKQVFLSKKSGWRNLILGVVLLILAYVIGIVMLQGFDIEIVFLILLFGVSGTFLLFKGLGVFIGYSIQKKSPSRSGLFIFTGRQIQENVLKEHTALAVSSLLLLMALACVSFGIGVASSSGAAAVRSVDFTIIGGEQDVYEALSSEESKAMISTYYPMYLDGIHVNLYDLEGEPVSVSPDAHEFSWDGLGAALLAQPTTDRLEQYIGYLTADQRPFLIAETSYNHLLESIGKNPLKLEKNQVAFYTSQDYSSDFIELLSDALRSGAYVEVDGQRYELLGDIYCDNVVADRQITVGRALIVSDENYQRWIDGGSEPFCWNVMLAPDVVQEHGLMQALQQMEQNLAKTGLEYESYLKGVGRNLFYSVAASYITIYLGILFMIIANTVIGLKYLMQQRTNKRRYLTLLMLGAKTKDLYATAGKQIRLYFFLALSVAVCSSIFAVWAMFTSFLSLPAGASLGHVVLCSGAVLALFVVVEFIYITIVERASRREIQALRVTDRR